MRDANLTHEAARYQQEQSMYYTTRKAIYWTLGGCVAGLGTFLMLLWFLAFYLVPWGAK